jgi:hypothetical protein
MSHGSHLKKAINFIAESDEREYLASILLDSQELGDMDARGEIFLEQNADGKYGIKVELPDGSIEDTEVKSRTVEDARESINLMYGDAVWDLTWHDVSNE